MPAHAPGIADAHRYGLILAGGRGTRFWPRSRRRSAKQVLNVVGARSLIQNTVERLRPVIPAERMWVLTNDDLRDEIVRQLPDVPARQILAEPVSRNTAPAIGLAACILQSIDPEAVMAVFPADHIIARESRYRQLVRAAFRAAERGRLVVLGIPPRWAETGYGYIEFPRGTRPGAKPVAVRAFHEKPDARAARRYVASGHFYWNAGMFFWRAGVFLDELRKRLPRTASILAALPPFRDAGFLPKLRAAFALCENISIDYGVMEKASSVAGIACPEIGWNDVGSWNAVYELLPHDPDGNVLPENSVCHAATGNYVDAGGKMVALVGVSDLIVIDTPDALLVADRRSAQQVGDVVKMLEKRERHDLL
ncbi:MAG TPA: mannose-1-phosphate guanylyltransferase [Bryobacteraceae bacterium]|nr:mannose-1-phosphate guanylyltransferase [Bryobacteraceae bacterium]